METGEGVVGGYDPVASEATWQRSEFIDDFLARQLSRGSVSLVVGAGVSMGFNLPSWDRLVERMYVLKGEDLPLGLSSAPELSERLKYKFYRGNEIGFADLVRQALYSDLGDNKEIVLSSPLLQAVGSFLVSSIRGRAGASISFNFDDLIETYLRLLGFVVCSEPHAPYWKVSADMQVLHPHGLLPQDFNQKATDIVFTESDYDRVIGVAEDAWNQSMRAVMSGSTSIFLGLSGNDQRLRSLLSQVKSNHLALTRERHAYWAVSPSVDGEDEGNVDRWRRLGVAPRKLKSYGEIPAWLLSICQKAAGQYHPFAKQ